MKTRRAIAHPALPDPMADPVRCRSMLRRIAAIGARVQAAPSGARVALGLSTALLIASFCGAPAAQTRPVEIHDRISPASGANNRVALTLDACSGAFDEDLILFLVRNRIPATLFATERWLRGNRRGVALLKANLDLFDIEDHGENHVPAVTGVAPHWYRGAAASYDQQASDQIRRMGYKIAGFSVNADAGATLNRRQIVERLRRVQGGDVIIAHMNQPASDIAEGLSAGLLELLRRGLVFARLDQVELVEVDSRK